MRRSEKLIGTAGELFTAFELTMLGVECDLIKQDGTDVVAVKGDGVLLAQRIEVKTATSVDKKKCYCFSTSKGKPKRPYTKFDCDIIALVALPQRNIQFMSVESLPTLTKKVHIDTFEYDRNLIERSWNYALEKSLTECKKIFDNIQKSGHN